jgi:hypothetical protein
MATLKLPRLPDRIPVKLSIAILPELHQRLSDYAALYRRTYGVEEPVAELIPHMLDAFLASDRTFTRGKNPPTTPSTEDRS